MFDAFFKLFEHDNGESNVALGEKEVRLAAAALLIHAGFVDGTYEEEEEARLSQLLEARFNLSGGELTNLLRSAERDEREAVDLFRFTSVLAKHLDQKGRQDIVEMLWEVCLADGEVHEFEENLVGRVSELLGVSTRDRIRLRKEAEARI